MAKGYPSRQRARKAYWMGFDSVRKGRPKFNPYANPRLHALFERGRERGMEQGRKPQGPGRRGGAAAPPRGTEYCPC
jgi:hypothetical protein